MKEYKFIYIAKVWGKDLFNEEIHKMVPFKLSELPIYNRFIIVFLFQP